MLSPLRWYGAEELENLMMRMTKLDPEQRPASVAEVQAEFTRLGLVPVQSPPPDALKGFVKDEIVQWADIVQKAGLAGSQ